MIHWNESCAEKIFTLEKTIARMKMEHVLEMERLIGEIACLKKKSKLLEHKPEITQTITVVTLEPL